MGLEAVASPPAEGHEAAIVEIYGEIIGGWNEQDAARFAAAFDEHGAVIGFDGSDLDGRAAIADELTRIFADHQTARYVAKVRSVRLISPEVALLRSVVGMIPPGESDLKPERNAHQTLLAVQRDDRWRVVLFQNTPAAFDGRPELVEQLTSELRRVARG